MKIGRLNRGFKSHFIKSSPCSLHSHQKINSCFLTPTEVSLLSLRYTQKRTDSTPLRNVRTIFNFRRSVSMNSSPSGSVSFKGSHDSFKLGIIWFRNDLRIHDNYLIDKAIDACEAKEVDAVLPIFCFDPRTFGKESETQFGTTKTGIMRTKFYIESVKDLRSNLRNKLNSDLYVCYNKPEEELATILSENIICDRLVFWFHKEITKEETDVERSIHKMLISKKREGKLSEFFYEPIWGNTLVSIDDLPFSLDKLPTVFTPYRNKVEKNFVVKAMRNHQGKSLPLPGRTVMDDIKGKFTYLPNYTDFQFDEDDIYIVDGTGENTRSPNENTYIGGENSALARLQDYIWEKDLLKVYFETRNGLLGMDYSTKFSPWLACGNLSPRKVYYECQKYEEERVKNKSTYWVVFELLWRDYFRFYLASIGDRIFYRYGDLGAQPNAQRQLPKWNYNEKTFQKWKDGMTGIPFIDANMRELKATGFMSNRGRQNVASFLIFDLHQDWRRGADYFESVLLDYDVTSNWGNWHAAAGLSGGRINKFNILKQASDYDSSGDYVRFWCPELQNVPGSKIHQPWKLSKTEQQEYNINIGVTYPRPIVDLVAAGTKNFQQNTYNKGGSKSHKKNHFNKGGRKQKQNNREY